MTVAVPASVKTWSTGVPCKSPDPFEKYQSRLLHPVPLKVTIWFWQVEAGAVIWRAELFRFAMSTCIFVVSLVSEQ